MSYREEIRAKSDACIAWARALAKELGPDWIAAPQLDADGEPYCGMPAALKHNGTGAALCVGPERTEGRYSVSPRWPRWEGTYYEPRDARKAYGSTHDKRVPIARSASLVRKWLEPYLPAYVEQDERRRADIADDARAEALAARMAAASMGQVGRNGRRSSYGVYPSGDLPIREMRVQGDEVSLEIRVSESLATQILDMIRQEVQAQETAAALPLDSALRKAS